EQIDIGGPAMVRAAAKNFANVATVVSPESYPAIIAAVAAGGTDLVQRRELAARAVSHTATYDTAVAPWFSAGTLSDGVGLPGRPASGARGGDALRQRRDGRPPRGVPRDHRGRRRGRHGSRAAS